MDAIINAALEEICVGNSSGAAGISIADLWRSLAATLSSTGLHPSDSVRKAIWSRLLSLPVIRFSDNGCLISSQDPKVQSLDEAERLGLMIVADEQLMDSFVGLDDLNAAAVEMSEKQRLTLKRIAAKRNKGITQCELAKEFDIKGNNFFYLVRNLESQQLIIRKSTTLWEKEVKSEVESGLKSNPVSTNMLHLYRYAKYVNLNSQQKFEIVKSASPDMSESMGNVDKKYALADFSLGECHKEDVLIKDYLPAMQAVCDKLDEENEKKTLVVKDIKVALGYRMKQGHRAWRNVVKRLEDAGFVKKFEAKVNGRDDKCLRLLKRFDRNYFSSKHSASTYDGFDFDNLPKHGKRGHITDQYLELPMEYCIYDMVDDEGPKGITIREVCDRLGLTSKKMYKRIIGLCSRFGMCMESEKPDRTQSYRVWTPKNYKQYSNIISPGNCQTVPIKNRHFSETADLVPCDQSSPKVQLSDSSIHDKDLHSQKMKTHSAQGDFELPLTCDEIAADTKDITCCMVPQNLSHEVLIADNDAEVSTTIGATCSSIVSSETHQSVPIEDPLSVLTTTAKQTQWYRSVASTMLGTRRIQWILSRLEVDKFIISSELHRELKELEKDKPTAICRKTLNRALNKLKQDGLCKITQVSIPTSTNCNRSRLVGVILHPSMHDSVELRNQILERSREFENHCRSRESSKSTDQPITVLTGVKRSSYPVDDKLEMLRVMRENGYVQAKMVRAKLLHNFLWDYTSSLPDWQNTSPPSTKDGHNLKNRRKTCPFSMDVAAKAMLLELFLQIVGCTKVIDDMVQKCRVGLRLMDLSVQECNLLLDTHATARLSCLIDILLRLKLLQLVWQEPVDMDVQPNVPSLFAIELEPYIEEPLPRVQPSLKINSLDLRPRIRHDFLFSKKEAVTAYWETLEYCYTAADLESASRSFPGSAVREIFNHRSWTSVRVMTAYQRVELFKRMRIDDLEKKFPFTECVKIARELNLSVEQVLRVSYDKRQRCAQRAFNGSQTKELGKCESTNSEHVAKKRRTSKDRLDKYVSDAANRETPSRPTLPDLHGHDIYKGISMVTDNKILGSAMDASGYNSLDDYAIESEPHVEEDQSLPFIQRASNPVRTRAIWTDESDRQLVMQYARRRVIMGERFYRVMWSLEPDLPNHPSVCRRRMAKLMNDESTRKAVLRLCNLLAERYSIYLDNGWRTQEKSTFDLGDSARSSQGIIVEKNVDPNKRCGNGDTQTCFQPKCWDDFEDPTFKMAVDEVLRCRRMAKLEHSKRCPRHEQSLPDAPPTDVTDLNLQENVTSVEENSSSYGDRNGSHVETGNENSNSLPTTAPKRSISHYSCRKFTQLLSSRGIETQMKVCESITVANAVELLKLGFLSNFATPEVQTSLTETLQRYHNRDLVAAFDYLKEREFVAIRNGNYVLSPKFWHNASSSPFPIDSGKRATSFSTWIHGQDKNLEGGVDLMTETQCGEIFHLFALIYSGQVSISPILPKEGIGESNESKDLQSHLMMDDDEVGLPCSSGKNKKQKSPGKGDSDFSSRREKGFPGMKVCISRTTIPRHDALQCPSDGENYTGLSTHNEVNGPSLSDKETMFFTPSLSSLGLSDNSRSKNRLEASLGESLYDRMTKCAELLASALVSRIEASTFCPELFRSVCSVLDQAGELGLTVEEISSVIGIHGVQFSEVVLDTLEVFQLAIKVNAYDCIRVVASSYRSKYFIGIHSNNNQVNFMASYTRIRGLINYQRAQRLSQDNHDDNENFENDSAMTLSDGHKLTLLSLPPEPSLDRLEVQPNEKNNKSGGCNQANDVSVKGNEFENRLPSDSVVSDVYLPIYPWINGDGSTDTRIYKGLTRRILGTVMQNPGILEISFVK